MKYNTSRFAACLVAAFFPLLALAGPVNVNTADAETLSAELQGVGLSRAQAIVAFREAHGPFASVDDLVQVKGIGARTIELNRANILLDSPGNERDR